MRMSTSTIRNVLFSVVCMLVALAGFIFMVVQTDKQGKQLATQVETLAAQRAQEESFFRLQRIAEETKEERAELQSHFLLNDSDIIDFFTEVESLAPQAGVELGGSSLESIIDDTDSTQWVEVDLSFSGSQNRVKDFIKILEQLSYVSRLTSVNIQSQSPTQWQAAVTMRVRVLAYES